MLVAVIHVVVRQRDNEWEEPSLGEARTEAFTLRQHTEHAAFLQPEF